MNGEIKFHPAKSPAFNAGEVWVDSTGRQVEIASIRCFGAGEKFDGQGNTAWEAVQSAHALHEMQDGRG